MKLLLICSSILIVFCAYGSNKNIVKSNDFKTSSLGVKKIFISWIEKKLNSDALFQENCNDCKTNDYYAVLKEKYMILREDLSINNTNIINNIKNILSKVNPEYNIIAPSEMIYLVLVDENNKCSGIISLNYFKYEIVLLYGQIKKNKVYFDLIDGNFMYEDESKSKELFDLLIPIILKKNIPKQKIEIIKKHYPMYK